MRYQAEACFGEHPDPWLWFHPARGSRCACNGRFLYLYHPVNAAPGSPLKVGGKNGPEWDTSRFVMRGLVHKPLLEKSCWFSQAKSDVVRLLPLGQGSGGPSNLWGLHLCPGVVMTLWQTGAITPTPCFNLTGAKFGYMGDKGPGPSMFHHIPETRC